MKRVLFVAFIIIGFSSLGFAQKFAFVDTKYILDNIPDYQMAQNQLNDLSKKWQDEIDVKIAEIDKMYKSYQTDAVLLPEDMKKKRQSEILEKEKQLKELQKKRFGQNGDLFKKREELVKPLQDKVYNAIEEYANEKGFSIIFDKASSATILFASSKLDKSDDILSKLGYSGASKTTTPTNKTENSTTPDEGK